MPWHGPRNDPCHRAFGLRTGTGVGVRSLSDGARVRMRSHVFRVWTAGAILAAYIYGWFYVPELLTWWKRTTEATIEAACDLLPYPWGDRIEATIGNFGLWVQITLAIIVFRILVWVVMATARRMRSRRPPERS
jgi:hypothetical protein